MDKYLNNFKNCLQKEPPFCSSTCPFDFDILAFIERVSKGNFNAAYKVYRNAVGFPAIVSNLCEEKCKELCPLSSKINLNEIEKSVVLHSTSKTPTDYNLPARGKKIAIVGGGPSGLGCLLKLSTKKYHVSLFEKTSTLGGTLNQTLDPSLVLEDINLQLLHEEYHVDLGAEISSLESLVSKGFDAIYVATGKNGEAFGFDKTALDPPCFMLGATGVFFGGGLLGGSQTEALATGLSIGVAIDNFLRTNNLHYPAYAPATKTVLDPALLHHVPSVKKTVPVYSKEEAVEEASRCIRCQCNPCRTYCDLTAYSNKWPLRIRDEIQATTLPGTSEVKATPAKRLISTCTQCGLCLDTCPEDIDLGGLILAARKNMHRQEKQPWAFSEFWLRDMLFSNQEAGLKKPSPFSMEHEVSKTEFLFFPGCQLSAGAPDTVFKSYDYLLSQNPNTGIFLGCCGLPADWSGNEDLTNETLEDINNAWVHFGKPTFVLACPSCRKFFKEFLPNIKTTFIYEIMSNDNALLKNPLVFPSDTATCERGYAIFDPCSTKPDASVRSSVRSLVEKLGLTTVANDYHEKFTGCCGFGGQSEIADPAFVKYVRARRRKESSAPYITYCVNCRDSFIDDRPETIYLLDLLFGESFKNFSLTQRRENRVYLKQLLLKKHWREIMELSRSPYFEKVKISPELETKLNHNKILFEDIFEVIDYLETSNRRVYTAENDSFSGYKKIGHGTFWVEYKVLGAGSFAPRSKPISELSSEEATALREMGSSNQHYQLINAYSHRISIDLEEVWNGEKRSKTDML